MDGLPKPHFMGTLIDHTHVLVFWFNSAGAMPD
jgi:hypothetical protein